MSRENVPLEHYLIFKNLVRWSLLVIPIAVAIGTMVALFLWLLHQATAFRFKHPWLLYLLPVAGLLIHFIYQSVGKSSEKGNNLVIEEIHQPGGGVPQLMATLIFITTIITHLFGGSAGREGTAVQIGGSIAGMFGAWLKLNKLDMRLVLVAGVAAGFGAVFGTPLTGAIFALEVLTIGQIQYNALMPALIASIIGDVTVAAWGVHHTQYHIAVLPQTTYFMSEYLRIDMLLLLKIMFASVAFGLAGFLFAGLVQVIKNLMLKLFRRKWMIPVVGGITIIGLTFILSKPDYLGLGVEPEYPGAVTITSAFYPQGADTWSWLWKTIYTAITLGTGYKGGEVTPLFYIGATLGNTLADLMNAPVSLFAALGFIAVFAGATNTPLACTIMGVELFGGEHILLFAVACIIAYFFSGHTGIYSSQRIAVPKILYPHFPKETSLTEAYHRRRYLTRKFGKYKNLLKRQKKNQN